MTLHSFRRLSLSRYFDMSLLRYNFFLPPIPLPLGEGLGGEAFYLIFKYFTPWVGMK